MPLKLNFSPDGKWNGGARIPSGLRDISSFSVWAGKFIKLFKELGKSYAEFFRNDGELVGQEKANLVIELDGLIGGLLILRQYLTPGNPGEFHSRKNKYHYRFSVRIDSGNWKGEGWFSRRYVFAVNNFLHWYNNIMLKKMLELFQMYKEAMSDNVLTDGERDSLILFIETIIFDILVIEKVLVSMDIHT